MQTLTTAAVQQIRRLLLLYPKSSLSTFWPDLGGSKEDVAVQATADLDHALIARFALEQFGCCKQHVYIHSHDLGGTADIPALLDDASLVRSWVSAGWLNRFHILDFAYEVIIAQPLQRVEVKFLWPVLVSISAEHLITRFVIMQKDVGSYIGDQRVYTAGRSIDERTVLNEIVQRVPAMVVPLDITKAVKEMAERDLVTWDSVRYRLDVSTDSSTLDEGANIKEHRPELYEQLRDAPVLRSVLTPKVQGDGEPELKVRHFSIDPPTGLVSFRTYADEPRDIDAVIERILDLNA